MTVEAYLRSLVIGLEFTTPILERCAYSPKKDLEMEALDLSEEINPSDEDYDDFWMRLDYASSVLYYSVVGVLSGGGFSEQIRDIRVSQSNYSIKREDRAHYKALADQLRTKWGLDVESVYTEDSGMFDASSLRRRP